MSTVHAQSNTLSNEEVARLDAEERWNRALQNYREETGHDLLQHSFAKDIISQSRTDEVMAKFTEFKDFRSSGSKILRLLKPIVSVVLRFIDAGAEAGSVRRSSAICCVLYLIS